MSDLDTDHSTITRLNTTIGTLKKELSTTQQKLEAAEARIKASQEQGPFGYLDMQGRMPDFHFKENSHLNMLKVYAAPVIPPYVAELQRDNAELTRKLAEQQAALFTVRAILAGCEENDAVKAVAHIQKHFADKHEELTALISKAMSNNMVPVGYFQLVNGRYEQTVHPVNDAEYISELRIDTSSFFQLYAPQPETDRGSNE